MKITFISPYSDVTAFGIRSISSYIKEAGHESRLVFLADLDATAPVERYQRYDDTVLDGLIPICRDSDVIGITLMTNFFERAVQITEKIKSELNIPVLWGGIHPTIRPEECLGYADMVCVGDGEEAVLELLDKMQKKQEYLETRNFWFKRNGSVIKNSVRPLIPDLDVFLFPDYSLDEHYLLFQNKILKMTEELLRVAFHKRTVSDYISEYGYQTMTSRGCPHKCTYCANDTLKNLYGGQNYLRWRSVNHVINELQWVRKRFPFVTHIWFSDDTFFFRSPKKIEDFCIQYKEKIGLPFFALASPLTVTEEKMDMLVDAGLVTLQMGIESGSRRIQELFNRRQMSNERVMKALRIINKYKDKILPPHYDFIIDTPFENNNDKIETLRFISRMPKPYRLQTFSLLLYPGTRLYEMAKSEGLIKNEREEIYNFTYGKRESDYFNLLYALAKRGKFPGFLLRILITKPVVLVLNSNVMRPFIQYFDIVIKHTYRRLKRLFGRRGAGLESPA